MRSYTSVLVVSLIGIPAVAAGQSGGRPSRVEIGAVVGAFAAPAGQGSISIGPRVTTNVTPRVGIQFDLRFSSSSFFNGLYGIRARYTPGDEDSRWYAFGGVGGAFAIPHVTHQDASGVRRSARVSGGMTAPILLSGGLGARVAAAKRWEARLEGEAWTSALGGFALAVGFEVAFGGSRH